ncbi:cytochrome c oxidase assembly protein COX16 homolog, mitochondrial [Diorhabda carinulata]|uniref:cytochrome c oxidase assembly protein COX16 homolog, mitochondrial n=1 Tax=Diorhabda sublineata TaxID=1163346 RepID=UPI0024E0B08E|nr:cytochrome c oxidase assembly protein COX16 homolog, mitochondrial [Diorhabda sublineata]XP_057664563.1 cytochrome c oxidase assembly protein COX16 homolog, mitochondrial [Diorhabda carinulata]
MAQVSKISRLLNKRIVKFGLPFFVLMIGGSFGLREFTNLRYQFSRVSLVKREELEKLGIEMKKPGEVTLESEYEKIKNLDIDNWEQVRGPRPWEEPIVK